MQKAKRKAESSSRTSESTAFIHVVKKGTVRMRNERRYKESKRKNNNLRVVLYPWCSHLNKKNLFQIITFQTLKVIWQLTLNIEFSSHSIHNLECDRGTRESRLPRGPQCVSLMPLLWRRPVPQRFLHQLHPVTSKWASLCDGINGSTSVVLHILTTRPQREE